MTAWTTIIYSAHYCRVQQYRSLSLCRIVFCNRFKQYRLVYYTAKKIIVFFLLQVKRHHLDTVPVDQAFLSLLDVISQVNMNFKSHFISKLSVLLFTVIVEIKTILGVEIKSTLGNLTR